MGSGGPDEPRGGVGYADLHALSDADRGHAITSIGIPQQVSSQGTLDALPVTQGWLASLPDSADGLSGWAEQVASDPEFAAIVYRTLMTGDMGGQLFVRTVEVPESVPRSAALAVEVAPDAFFSLPFEEAIAAFLARGIISPDEYRRLSADARAQAFSVSRLTSMELVRRIRDLLGRSLEEGGDYRSFVQQVRDGEIDLGITPTSPGYLETIFRTNTQSAYGAGRLRQITSPVVVEARPFVEYRTARDSRVRPSHAALEGVVFRQDDPGWRRFNPPNGYNCRCTCVTRRPGTFDLTRVRDSSSLTLPDPDFGAPTI